MNVWMREEIRREAAMTTQRSVVAQVRSLIDACKGPCVNDIGLGGLNDAGPFGNGYRQALADMHRQLDLRFGDVPTPLSPSEIRSMEDIRERYGDPPTVEERLDRIERQLREVEPSRYDRARERWGDDPEKWPDWNCSKCQQQDAGWTLECGRCKAPREGGL